MPAIDDAISSLNSAENWGVYDMIGWRLYCHNGKKI